MSRKSKNVAIVNKILPQCDPVHIDRALRVNILIVTENSNIAHQFLRRDPTAGVISAWIGGFIQRRFPDA